MKLSTVLHTSRSQQGFVMVYLMLFMVILAVGTVSMIEMQQVSLQDNKYEANKGSARNLALSALQEATYYVQKTSPGWTGSTSEQSVSTNGKTLGTYEYTVSKSGSSLYTVTAKGYFPSKTSSDKNKITVALTKQFNYESGTSSKGLVLLGTSGTVLNMNSNGVVTTAVGNVVVASNSNSAIMVNSNATVNANEIAIVGNYTINSNGKITGTIRTGYSGGVSDPYASIPEPNEGDYTVQKSASYSVNSNQSATLSPGVYKGSVNFNSNTTITLQPGVYFFKGGVSINSNSKVTGNGVMIYNDGGGAFNMASNATLNLTAQTSGTYQGFAFFQKRTSSTAVTVNSNAGTGFNGSIYAPGAQLTINSNGTVVMKGESNVFKSATVNSNGNLTITPTVATSVAVN